MTKSNLIRSAYICNFPQYHFVFRSWGVGHPSLHPSPPPAPVLGIITNRGYVYKMIVTFDINSKTPGKARKLPKGWRQQRLRPVIEERHHCQAQYRQSRSSRLRLLAPLPPRKVITFATWEIQLSQASVNTNITFTQRQISISGITKRSRRSESRFTEIMCLIRTVWNRYSTFPFSRAN